MFPMANPPNPGLGNAASNEWERDAPNSSTPSLTPHQSLSDEDTGISYLPTTGFIWPNMAGSDPTVANGGNIGSLPEPIHEEHDHSNYNEMRHMNDENGVGQEETEMRDDSEGDQHEPCIVVACRTLSSLYQFVQSDCMNGHASNDAQSRKILKPPTPEEPSTNDTVFWMTRSATETISRLLNCAGRSCAHDPPTFLVFGSVLLKILSWYEAMYQSEIGGLVLSTTPLANGLEGVGSRPHHSNDSQFGDKNSTGLSQPSENMKESTYAVPLTIPLAVDAFNMSRATETKMKAQLLLCEVQALSHVCHTLNRRVQAVVGIQGENNMYGQANVDLLRKLGELQHALTVVCTQVPSLG
ncbi:Ribosomal protein L10e/L16 [Penicillium vulpinum]|nr:Ribosomal protein L10e/L16 [Penicillium vulpinum]KAJ5961285.1 Ribosomal protein L10e/L16 [Penicillium vulpinum]